MGHLYKCVVFDLDGTLLDTSEGMLAAVRYTVDRFGLEPLSEEVIKSFIGPRIQDSFKRLYHFDDQVISEMALTFRERYKEHDLLLAAPYKGIYDVFDALKKAGIQSAIATYKREDYALRLLRHFGFDRYTDAMYGSDFEGRLQKKDIIELALKKAGVVDPRNALMIGDSDNDAAGAAEIGMDFLGVTYGFGFRTEEEILKFGAVGAAESADEIIRIISGVEK